MMQSLAVFMSFVAVGQASQPAATRPAALTDVPPLIAASVRHSLAERIWIYTSGRTRDATQTERRAYEAERSAVTLAGLREIGVNLLAFPYGGSGPGNEERVERDFAAAFARQARAGGFGVALWLPIDQIVPELWTSGAPVDDWLLRDESGRPASGSMPRGSQLSSWSRPAVAHQLMLLDAAEHDIAPDMYLLPHLHSTSGYEAPARAAFKAAHQLEPPSEGDTTSPAARLWQRFRADAVRSHVDALRRALAVRAVSLGAESSVVVGEPRANIGPAADNLALAQSCDVIWWKSLTNVESNGRIRTGIPMYRAFDGARARVVLESVSALGVAESLVFGRNTTGCIAHFTDGLISADPASRKPLDVATVAMAHFLASHQPFYRRIERVADMVLWLPTGVNAARMPAEQVLNSQTEGSLVAHRYLYGTTTDEHLANLLPGQLLLLVGNRPLSTTLGDGVLRHLKNGGGVACIGRQATESDLRSLVTQRAAALEVSPDGSGRWRVGQGRVVQLARFGPVTHTWLFARRGDARRPPSADDTAFRQTLAWAAGDQHSVESAQMGACYVELTRAPERRLTLAHVINYDMRQPTTAGSLTVRLPSRAKVRRVQRYEPASEHYVPMAASAPATTSSASAPASTPYGPADAPFTQSGDRVTIQASPCGLYDLYVIEH